MFRTNYNYRKTSCNINDFRIIMPWYHGLSDEEKNKLAESAKQKYAEIEVISESKKLSLKNQKYEAAAELRDKEWKLLDEIMLDSNYHESGIYFKLSDLDRKKVFYFKSGHVMDKQILIYIR